MTTLATSSVKQAWWEEEGGFFGRGFIAGDTCYTRDTTYRTLPEQTALEVRGLLKLLELRPRQSILDCPCGYGRHAIALARRGLDVVGVDINAEELRFARRKAGSLKNLHFVKHDMRRLDFANQFNAVINMSYSFSFFETDEENFQVLQHFNDALKPGGQFLMHTWLRALGHGSSPQRWIGGQASGERLEVFDHYDPIRKRITGHWTFIHDDQTREALTPYSIRVYSFEEFAEWCYAAGFRQVAGYATWTQEPLTANVPGMLVVARK